MKMILELSTILVVWCSPAFSLETTHLICATCECLYHTSPFDVDCKNQELHEVPDLTPNNITYPWILNFDNNLIQEVPVFPRQESLISLTLRRNRITKINDGAFKNLVYLKELYLQKNLLTGDMITNNVFKGLYNNTVPEPLGLEVLDLGYNNITTIKNNAFVHLRSLKKLLLPHNPIKDISYSTAMAINELVNLQELDLSQTGISRFPDHFLADLRNLQVLILAGNNFNTVPEELNYAHNLRLLNLNANPIISLTLGDFQESLNTLRILEISAMPELRNVGARTFSKLKSLEILRMSDCPALEVLDPLAFYVMDGDELTLKEIHIQDNQLKTLSKDMLPWLDLQVVDIQNNPWNCDCHFRWVAETLIPDLERKNPGLTLSILCTYPAMVRGTPVIDMLSRSDGFSCRRPSVDEELAAFGPLSIGIIIVGVLLLLTGSMIFAYVLFRRSQSRLFFGETVKYRRAQNEDTEAVPS
ncbi:leucine-rich repeat neuronal protein 3-like isoform X1 [Macrobrachium rosenbergii]|uniref:leucine-rich repeat neuronal protein 3-like isoform X1 n=2 Tax=Macrobrachium rosenbergii TaxID=79674 RepID=UPI0034D5BB4B